MILIVRAKHFKDTIFIKDCECALAKAAKEQFNTPFVEEGLSEILIGEEWYDHEWYGAADFELDYYQARAHDFSDRVIREIKLTPQP